MAVVKSPKNTKKKNYWIKAQDVKLKKNIPNFNNYIYLNKLAGKNPRLWTHRSNIINKYSIKENLIYTYI